MTTSDDLAPVTAAPDHETRTTPSARRSSVCARPSLPIATASRAALYLLGAALAACSSDDGSADADGASGSGGAGAMGGSGGAGAMGGSGGSAATSLRNGGPTPVR